MSEKDTLFDTLVVFGGVAFERLEHGSNTGFSLRNASHGALLDPD